MSVVALPVQPLPAFLLYEALGALGRRSLHRNMLARA